MGRTRQNRQQLVAGIRHKEKGHAMNQHENKPMKAHDSWADYYDCVYKLTQGEASQQFTDQTLRVIRRLAAPPARVVDFGAGTGRLAIPLARAGYTVAAVDASAQMCRVLRVKAAAGVEGAVVNHCTSCETNPGAMAQQAGVKVAVVNQTICRPVKKSGFDLGVCVFTVLNYLFDDLDLRQFVHAAAHVIRVDGKLLVSFVEDMRPMQQSLNGQHTNESWDRECSVVRNINVLQLEHTLYEYHEQTKLAGERVKTEGKPRLPLSAVA
jgi:SAM-dependent methyltransferase